MDGRAWQVQKVIERRMDGVSCVPWEEYAKVERSWDEYSVTQCMHAERHTYTDTNEEGCFPSAYVLTLAVYSGTLQNGHEGEEVDGVDTCT